MVVVNTAAGVLSVFLLFMEGRIKAQKGIVSMDNCLNPGRNDQGITETPKNTQKLKIRYEKYQQTPK